MFFLFRNIRVCKRIQNVFHKTFKIGVISFCFIFLVGCSESGSLSIVSPSTPSFDPYEWRTISSGVEHKKYAYIRSSHSGEISVFRIDPGQVHAHIENTPEDPKSLLEWGMERSDFFLFNAAYFHDDFSPSGFLVENGIREGTRMFDQKKTGLVQIQDGRIFLRDLKASPISETESFEGAFQSYPFLLLNGKNPIKKDSGKTARRTALGTDKDGFLYLFLVDHSLLSLYEFGEVLEEGGLGISVALNLDGGPSSGVYGVMGDEEILIPSYSLIPSVVVVDLQ